MRISILGMGSVLMGDDALGPVVVSRLEAGWSFPDNVTVQDVGTPGPELFHYVRGADHLIIVDTVRSDAPPGTVKLYRRDELLRAPVSPRLTPHEPGLADALVAADMAGDGPQEVLLVGVVPARVKLGTGLTEQLQAALPEAEAAVLAELERVGAAATARAEPLEPDIWWER